MQPRFLAIPATLALLFAGGIIAMRRVPQRVAERSTDRAIAHLNELARLGDAAAFYIAARELLLQHFSNDWRMPAEEISAAEIEARLGADGREIERLFALADEAKYSGTAASRADLSQWLQLVRRKVEAS